MRFEDPRLNFAARHAAAIRTAYWERVRSKEARLLEPLVRSLAREGCASGITAERVIVALKLSIHGELPYLLAQLATQDDQRKYELFERVIGWVLDEYFERPAGWPEVRGRMAS
ncbi:MAG TPA: hypothetical protein VK922_05520 [Gemmatimonadaceae bacterium]|nr:hypothetical protein [Gemmatimonadaceae bacterium]